MKMYSQGGIVMSSTMHHEAKMMQEKSKLFIDYLQTLLPTVPTVLGSI